MALVWSCPSCPGTVLAGAGACRSCGSTVRLPIAGRPAVPDPRRRRLAPLVVLGLAAVVARSFGGDTTSGIRAPEVSVCDPTNRGSDPLLDDFELIEASAGIVGRLAVTPGC